MIGRRRARLPTRSVPPHEVLQAAMHSPGLPRIRGSRIVQNPISRHNRRKASIIHFNRACVFHSADVCKTKHGVTSRLWLQANLQGGICSRVLTRPSLGVPLCRSVQRGGVTSTIVAAWSVHHVQCGLWNIVRGCLPGQVIFSIHCDDIVTLQYINHIAFPSLKS